MCDVYSSYSPHIVNLIASFESRGYLSMKYIAINSAVVTDTAFRTRVNAEGNQLFVLSNAHAHTGQP